MSDRSKLFTRIGKLGEDDDRIARYKHWDRLGNEARFKAAWELVIEAAKMKGQDLNELRFQKSVTNIIRKGGE